MFLYTIKLPLEIPLDQVWETFEQDGLEPLYSEEEASFTHLHIQSPAELDETFQNRYPFVMAIAPFVLPEINWEDQWQRHAENYQEGFLKLFIKGIEVKLAPGAGFGDLSHPTTRLMVQAMEQTTIPLYVIDIGCGSGILACAAAALGAERVDAIDIDPDALDHTVKNAIYNHMEGRVFPFLPEVFKVRESQGLLLMNMIQTEQKEALANLPSLKNFKGQLITSGVLEEEKQEYLAWMKSLGWSLLNRFESEGWLSFIFQRN